MKKTKGVIAAGSRLTAEAGAEVLMSGGNAYDAAVAATFMSFAASATITSAGGGGFLLANPAVGSDVVYDFFVQTPLARRKDGEIDFFPVTVDFGDKSQEFHIGLGAVATPGCIAGLFRVHHDLGSMPMQELMQPVLERMKKGIEIQSQDSYQIEILKPILGHTLVGKDIYFNGENTRKIGEKYYLQRMVDLFEYLSRTGHREFYEGEIARKVALMCLEKGGHLTAEDFQYYEPAVRKPLPISYRHHGIIANPPPNAGGALVAFLLKILERASFTTGSFGSSQHLQALTDAIRLTGDARSAIMTRESMDLELLFDEQFIESIGNTLMQSLHKSGNTTHVSVADAEGNIASVTTSHGEGCGYYIPDTDIMLNNMLGEEDLNKAGFHQWIPNRRMSSMMTPSVVRRSDGTRMGLGSGGSNRIRSAIAQAIINFADFMLPYDDIVNLPRIHFEGDHLDVEPGFRPEALEKIQLLPGKHIFHWSDKNMYFGGVHAVFIDEKGNMDGAGDARRSGHVIKV